MAAVRPRTADLADVHPNKLEELLAHWEQYVVDCGVVPLQPELGTYMVATEEQMPVSARICVQRCGQRRSDVEQENAWMEYEYW